MTKDKRIQGSSDPYRKYGATVKHTFKFDNDGLPQNIGPGTQVITCNSKMERENHHVLQIASNRNHNQSG